MNSQSVNIQWTFAELGEYISNTSAYVAKTLAQGADGVVFDTFTITEDEHAAFLNDKIEEAMLAVTPFFNRITPDASIPILPNDDVSNVGISFVPRIEGGEYSKTDFAFVESLTKKYIASYILFEWYSIKGVATMMQYFGGQRELAGSNLRDRLFRFVRPSRKSGITIRKVYGTRCDKTATTKVNNRSDFVLVWGSSDGSPLPEFNYDIVFYTEDNGLQYTVQVPSDNYKPIEGEDGVIRKAKIVFDLNGEYFPNGVLKYEMSGNVPDTDFPDGRRYFEQEGETNIEIWDGATDAQRAMDVAFLPAFINVRFEDLTPEEIAILQGPANSAASNANLAANRATNAAQEAEVATQTLISKADYAAAKGKEAELAAINAAERIIEINSTNSNIKAAEIKREEAEKEREGSWSNLSSAVNSAISSAYRSVSDANKATREATSAAESATSAKQEIQGFFNEVSGLEAVRQEKEAQRIADERERISHENERVSAENMRIEAENTRKKAETKREDNEAVRGTQETQRQKQEDGRVVAENAREEAESKRQKDTSAAILNAHQAADSANEAAESANEAAESIQNDLAKKADIDKFYPKMTVGKADALNTPSGSILHSQFVRLGAVWNDSTKFWKLNGLTDLTTSQMEKIWDAHITMGYCQSTARTNFPNNFWRTGGYGNTALLPSNGLFANSQVEEVICSYDYFSNMRYMFINCSRLRKVSINMSYSSTGSITDAFKGCTSLKDVSLYRICRNTDFSDCPLTIDSIVYMITKSNTGYNSVITLRSDIYQQAIADERVQEALATYTNITLAEAE